MTKKYDALRILKEMTPIPSFPHLPCTLLSQPFFPSTHPHSLYSPPPAPLTPSLFPPLSLPTRLTISVPQDMFLMAAMGPPGGGRTVISPRLQSRFNIINMTFPTVRGQWGPWGEAGTVRGKITCVPENKGADPGGPGDP